MALSFMNPGLLRLSGAHDRVYRALDLHQAAVQPSDQPVSVAEAVDHIRRTDARCGFSDSVLVDMIAAHSIQNGYSLKLDTAPGGGDGDDKR